MIRDNLPIDFFVHRESQRALATRQLAFCRCKIQQLEHAEFDPAVSDVDREGEGPYVVRLRAPREGETDIEDRVQGRVAVKNAEIDDFILLRSDGSPTYMLAVVVDDHDMGVTHIIRGDDHLTNAARQKQIYDALGWTVPVMAHIPLIHGADGAKLSKRHGALGVEAYRALGYLPAAMRNYLVRLGWAHGDQEIFSTAEMIKAFDLPAIGRAPARLDLAKLDSLNGHYIRQTAAELAGKLTPALRGKLIAAMPGLKERAKTLVELIESARYLYADRPLALDDKAAAVMTQEARGVLGNLVRDFAMLEPWSAETAEAIVRAYAERAGVKLGAVAQPLRAALTGRTTSPGIFEVLAVLGKAESLARIGDQTRVQG